MTETYSLVCSSLRFGNSVVLSMIDRPSSLVINSVNEGWH